MVTLEQLLESRDSRAERQRQLLSAFPGRALLCLTVQLPGSEKRNALSLAIARAGVEAVRQAFEPGFEEQRDLETGFEAYFLVNDAPPEAKRKACDIEDLHPLGRLMDIDVLTILAHDSCRASAAPASAGSVVPLGREDIGLAPRRCLLCSLPARVCMRSRMHTPAQLLDRIAQMVKSYEPL